LKELLFLIFQTFRVDVSRFSNEEIQRFREGKVDQMLNLSADPSTLTGEKFLDKGVDIGNQVSQNIGIIYPHKIDNYAKIVRGTKFYGRYTDDFYAIAPDKGVMQYADIENSFKSWIGANYKRMSRQQISNMTDLYIRLFRRLPTWKKGYGRLRWLMAQPSTGSRSTETTSSAKPS